MSDNGRHGEEGPGTGVVVKAKPKTKKPSMYKVLMLNDDYTPMEFVVHVLEQFFLIQKVGRLHPALTEELFRLVVPVFGIAVVAFTKRQDRPRSRRLGELHDLSRGLAAAA